MFHVKTIFNRFRHSPKEGGPATVSPLASHDMDKKCPWQLYHSGVLHALKLQRRNNPSLYELVTSRKYWKDLFSSLRGCCKRKTLSLHPMAPLNLSLRTVRANKHARGRALNFFLKLKMSIDKPPQGFHWNTRYFAGLVNSPTQCGKMSTCTRIDACGDGLLCACPLKARGSSSFRLSWPYWKMLSVITKCTSEIFFIVLKQELFFKIPYSVYLYPV